MTPEDSIVELHYGTRVAALHAGWKDTAPVEAYDLTFTRREVADEAVRRWALAQEGIR